jgi:hypothetical protein
MNQEQCPAIPPAVLSSSPLLPLISHTKSFSPNMATVKLQKIVNAFHEAALTLKATEIIF